jgi:hypothetical protein
MTLLEIIGETCVALVNDVDVVLTMPKGTKLPGFPRGELLNELERDGIIEQTIAYDPKKVAKWFRKVGFV